MPFIGTILPLLTKSWKVLLASGGEKNRPITSARTAYSGYPVGSCLLEDLLMFLFMAHDRQKSVLKLVKKPKIVAKTVAKNAPFFRISAEMDGVPRNPPIRSGHKKTLIV